MHIFKKVFESPEKRQQDVSFYEQALGEFNNEPVRGIYAKAISLSNGDESQVQARYLELRVDILRDKFYESTREEREISKKEKVNFLKKIFFWIIRFFIFWIIVGYIISFFYW